MFASETPPVSELGVRQQKTSIKLENGKSSRLCFWGAGQLNCVWANLLLGCCLYEALDTRLWGRVLWRPWEVWERHLKLLGGLWRAKSIAPLKGWDLTVRSAPGGKQSRSGLSQTVDIDSDARAEHSVMRLGRPCMWPAALSSIQGQNHTPSVILMNGKSMRLLNPEQNSCSQLKLHQIIRVNGLECANSKLYCSFFHDICSE